MAPRTPPNYAKHSFVLYLLVQIDHLLPHLLPRVPEILTIDGGLEHLVRLLRDFCTHPPPPDSPALFYGLSNPTPPPPANDQKRPFDCAAAYRFSLAFQCVVNIGVHGSEPIRARVVQAGTLDVVGCVLEAWLTSKGFAVAPSASASGMPHESREQRHTHRLAAAKICQRELHARELTRQLNRHADMSATANVMQPASSDTSNDTSPTSMPRHGTTPTPTVGIPLCDRGGTIIARPDPRRRSTAHPSPAPPTLDTTPVSAAASASSRTDTEPDSDAEAEMYDATAATAPQAAAAPSAAGAPPQPQPSLGRRTIGIVGDDDTATALEVNMNLDMLLASATDSFVSPDPAGPDARLLGTDDRATRKEGRTPRTAFARLPPAEHDHDHEHDHGHDDAPAAVAQSPAPSSSVHGAALTHDSGQYREEDAAPRLPQQVPPHPAGFLQASCRL